MKKTVIYTWSILYSTFPVFSERIPYVSAILLREDGTRFSSLLEGYQDGMEVYIGQEVRYLGTDAQGRERYSLEN